MKRDKPDAKFPSACLDCTLLSYDCAAPQLGVLSIRDCVFVAAQSERPSLEYVSACADGALSKIAARRKRGCNEKTGKTKMISASVLPWWGWLLCAAAAGFVAVIASLIASDEKAGWFVPLLGVVAWIVTLFCGVIGIVRFIEWIWMLGFGIPQYGPHL